MDCTYYLRKYTRIAVVTVQLVKLMCETQNDFEAVPIPLIDVQKRQLKLNKSYVYILDNHQFSETETANNILKKSQMIDVGLASFN